MINIVELNLDFIIIIINSKQNIIKNDSEKNNFNYLKTFLRLGA